MKNNSVGAFYVKCALVFIGFVLFLTQVLFMCHGYGNSMAPTMGKESLMFGTKIHFGYKTGDIIATKVLDGWGFEDGLSKRIVAVPGDVVVVDGVNTYVNGVLIDDSVMKPGYPYKEYALQEDEYFIMGDNRSVSYDSRAKGPIKEKDIEAKILYWIDK